MKRCILTLIALLLIGGLLHADEGRKGQAGFQFLRIPMGARQIAMGNSGLATAGGASALYWNPAGVSAQRGYEVQFSNVSWFGDVSYQHFTAVAGMGDFGALGLSVQYLAYPDIIETTEEAPNGTGGTLAPYDLGLVLTYSRQMTEKVSFGLNIKYVNETIGLVSADAFAFDIGLTYSTGYKGLKFGFLVSNYGTKGQFDGSGLRRFYTRPDAPSGQTPVPVLFEADKFELPSSVQIGFSFTPVSSDEFACVVNADQVINTFSSDRTNLGVELGYKEMMFLRGGYVTRTDFNEKATGNATFGVGLKYGLENNLSIAFDYAYADLGLLSNAQYITVGLTF
jgi:hypothetical protein